MKLLSNIVRTFILSSFLLLGANVAFAQTLYATTTPNTGAGASALINLVLILGSIATLIYGSLHLRKTYQRA